MPMTPDQVRAFNYEVRQRHNAECTCTDEMDHETIIAELIEDSYESLEGEYNPGAPNDYAIDLFVLDNLDNAQLQGNRDDDLYND